MTSTKTQLSVVMFTDLVGSVELKTQIGNARYVELIQRHDRIFQQLLDRIEDASAVDTGDGFLAQFSRIEDAVNTALSFQHAVRTEPWQPTRSRFESGSTWGSSPWSRGKRPVRSSSA